MKEKLQSRQNTKAEESFQFSSTDQSEMLDFISRHSVLYLQFPLWTFLHRQSIRHHHQTYHCHPADIPFPACDARQQQSLKAEETERSSAVVTVYVRHDIRHDVCQYFTARLLPTWYTQPRQTLCRWQRLHKTVLSAEFKNCQWRATQRYTGW